MTGGINKDKDISRKNSVCPYDPLNKPGEERKDTMRKQLKKSKTLIILAVFISAGTLHSLWAQFTSEEIKQRTQIEMLLKSSDINKAEDIGEGVTKPVHLFLRKDSQHIEGCWKNPKGMQQGFLEGWKYEIAAYELDKLLGLNMVPPTVERIYRGKKGSLQFWLHGGMSDLQRMENGISIPKEYFDRWEKRKYLTRAFDCLIANEDRTQQNIHYTDDWRTILIDHSRAFRSSRKFTKQLMYGRNGIKGVKLIRKLPRDFVTRIKKLDFDKIKNAVGPFLNSKEIKAVLKRKVLLLNEINEIIKEKGEANFLY